MLIVFVLAILDVFSILLYIFFINSFLGSNALTQVILYFVKLFIIANTIVVSQSFISATKNYHNNHANCCSRSQSISQSYFYKIDFRPLDEEYGWRNNYVQKLMIIESLRNFSNEKKCFQQLVPYYLNPFVNSECHNANDLIEFFNQNKEKLYFSCHVTDIYSHCQEFYVVTYDTMKDTCSSYFRKPCMINDQKE